VIVLTCNRRVTILLSITVHAFHFDSNMIETLFIFYLRNGHFLLQNLMYKTTRPYKGLLVRLVRDPLSVVRLTNVVGPFPNQYNVQLNTILVKIKRNKGHQTYKSIRTSSFLGEQSFRLGKCCPNNSQKVH